MKRKGKLVLNTIKGRMLLVCLLSAALMLTGMPGVNLNQSKRAMATSKSAEEAIKWVRSQLGQQLNGGECVGLITAYYSYLGVSPVGGNAKDYATNALPSGWSRVQGGQPQVGDILVYSGSNNVGASPFGHVAIYESDFSTFHQNVNGRTVQCFTNIKFNGFKNPYWGYIRPNWSNVSVNNPQGSIDAVEGGAGFVRVGGWGFDRDNLSTAIQIHVYIGGSAAELEKAEGHVIYADKGRGDVNQAFSCGGYHGFEETIPTKKTGEQVVWIYAINIGTGDNICLGSRTVNILPSPNPEGVLESVEGGAGFIKVAGWSFDRDNLSAALKVYVYIGGDASSGAEMHVIQADKGRGDVNQAFSCGGYHGFDDVIFTDKTGTQEVYVYAINVGNGNNVCLGSGTVNISPVSLGDVFQDGKVDGKDVSLLLQYRLGKKNLTAEQLAAGDVHKDGKIDGKDVSKLLQYRLGKIENLR